MSTICKTCGARLPDMRVPYVNIPPCDCCGTEGMGYLYYLLSGKSLCGTCVNNAKAKGEQPGEIAADERR
jgi:hypothetical protein